MTAETIRAALEAAERAPTKAAAVVAFLRALPEDFTADVQFDDGEVFPVGFTEDWYMLAAAVEEAARDE